MTEIEYQDCSYCAEKIKKGAKKCKHCHTMIEDDYLNNSAEKTTKNDDEQAFANENINDETSKEISKKAQKTNEPMNYLNQEGGSKIPATENSELNQNKTPAKDQKADMEPNKENFIWLSWVSYLLCALFVGMGFYKMFAYSNPDSSFATRTNVYVGGDAYNYIINANYATAYFALAILFAIIGMTGVIGYIIITQSANQAVRS